MFFGAEAADVALGAHVGVLLIDEVVVLGFGSDLREVGDSDDLSRCRHLPHDLAHLSGYVAAYTGVYLVEDDGGQPVGGCYQ